jgi:hypothetical protein
MLIGESFQARLETAAATSLHTGFTLSRDTIHRPDGSIVTTFTEGGTRRPDLTRFGPASLFNNPHGFQRAVLPPLRAGCIALSFCNAGTVSRVRSFGNRCKDGIVLAVSGCLPVPAASLRT